MVNLAKLFMMQKELDTKIETQHQLQQEMLFDRKILALLVEVGELANETRCFKFWSVKPPASIDVILEEYVDGIHFILSLGLEIDIEPTIHFENKQDKRTVTEQFLYVYQSITLFKDERSISMYKNMCEEYLFLGELLGFSSAQIEKAYVSKNEVNHERQKQGY
ncbi:dUTP diphosphatase [Metabacillus sediminilitoris]|uniref:dUTPase n=1 Tax=Metabacillus sediminilitoris TaxID=2567941 RepID=A0A4S4C2I8_9BACI|nr:dUTP diphosphatase [Metabacillus sediminilitoris]QGQ47472.1 dUTPase [Metabacillus sediminilitoris]THF81906.1 dUTPase [Metabacillus sediminilitoris]